MSPYLFVYGFLKRKFHGNRQTRTPNFEHRLVVTGTLPGQLYQVDVYPGAVYDVSSEELIHGEVFELTDTPQILAALDAYEHAAPLIQTNPEYSRRLRPVQTTAGVLQCWVYEYAKTIDPATKIHSGIF